MSSTAVQQRDWFAEYKPGEKWQDTLDFLDSLIYDGATDAPADLGDRIVDAIESLSQRLNDYGRRCAVARLQGRPDPKK